MNNRCPTTKLSVDCAMDCPVAPLFQREKPLLTVLYPSGRYIDSIQDLLATLHLQSGRVVLERDPVSGLDRSSRAGDVAITTVHFGTVMKPLIPNVQTDDDRIYLHEDIERLSSDFHRRRAEAVKRSIETLERECMPKMFRNMRWYIDKNDSTLNWVSTHIMGCKWFSLTLNGPEGEGYRIYSIE